MQRYLLLLVMLGALVTAAFAQPDPNNPGNQPRDRQDNRAGNLLGAGMAALGGQNAVLEIQPDGIFVLRNGVLAGYDPVTFKQTGTLELFGPLPARPAMPQNPTPQDREALRNWMVEGMARSAPAAMLAKDGALYIVIGNRYFCVNGTRMELVAKADLAAAEGANARRGGLGATMAAAQLKMEAGTLYALIGQNLLSVEPATGKVLHQVQLPREMFAMPQGFGQNNAQRENIRDGARGGAREGARNTRNNAAQ